MREKISDCWQTPQWLFNELDAEFNFDIDLCANETNHKCAMWSEDYLNIVLDGSDDLDIPNCAFMNPPYSNPKPFIEKAWKDSKYCKIVCLVKCDPSTRWWATFWEYRGDTICPKCRNDALKDNCEVCNDEAIINRGPKPGCEVRFFPKRIKFDPPKGLSGKSGPSFSSALVIMDRRNV